MTEAFKKKKKKSGFQDLEGKGFSRNRKWVLMGSTFLFDGNVLKLDCSHG